MATVVHLRDILDELLGKGQGPFLLRIFQDAGILPRAQRGGWRSLPTLTVEQVADTVMAIGGTRAAGARNFHDAREAVARFSELLGEPDRIKTVRERLVELLSSDALAGKWMIAWVLFVNDAKAPVVEMRFYDQKGERQRAENYNAPNDDLGSGAAAAGIVWSDLIDRLGVMLRKAPAPAEKATA